MMNAGMMNIGMVLYMIFIIVLLALMIFGGLLMISKLFNKGKEKQEISKQDRSVQILKERFARGEITKDEFEENRHILENQN